VKILHIPDELPCTPTVWAMEPAKHSVAVLLKHAPRFSVFDVREQRPALAGRRKHLPVPGHAHRLARTPTCAIDVVSEQLHPAAELCVELSLRGGWLTCDERCDRLALSGRQCVDAAGARSRDD
jgi:hypothetical protein